ncbi:NO-inducible flavohemoprotein [Virgibacillus salexigens]|uniref:NO-inducible flavohemoprotein n=1 Tax=Virgibacillus salexigens TaxID=61016 RepID=UPI003081DD28
MTNATESLDKRTIDVIKATVPVLQEHGEKITKQFYRLMLANHPELNNIFNQTNQQKGAQSKALANTIYAAAANIEHLEEIVPHIKQIAHKHTSINIKAEQYPIVGKYLLLAIKEVLGDTANEEILKAWEMAYNVIAEMFITIETEIYEQTQQKIGGWVGYRDFTVIKKVVESEVITSFYLKPTDGLPIPKYRPGQYITIKAQIEDEPFDHLRQYSLSTATNAEFYRISVKREPGNAYPKGIVSNFLHTTIHEGSILPISAPAGDFTLDSECQTPLVLISGGVGFTPLMSMLETVIEKQPHRQVIFIHAARSAKHHAMKDRVKNLTKEYANITNYVVYGNDHDDCDKHGHIDYEWLHRVIPTTNASFYVCGPNGFMQTILRILRKMEVKDGAIHYETFGPSADISA